jgi:hypothetical protein
MTMFPLHAKPKVVSQLGALAGCVLCGAGMNNQGLRLRISEAQEKGHRGGIRGSFIILDTGDNKHSQALRDLLGRPTDAEEVLAVIRRRSAGCVSVANANILTEEPG